MPYRRRGRKSYRRKKRGPYLRSEVKRLVVKKTLANIDDTAGRVTLLNGIAEGAGIDERVGRRVQVLSIHFRGIARKNPADVNIAQSVRYALVQDKAPTGTLPTCAQLWDTTGGLQPTVWPRLQDNLHRFKTVCTFTVVIHGDASDVTAVTLLPWEKFCKLRTNSFYLNTLGTEASMKENALYLFEVGSNGTNPAQSEFVATVRYRDP